jgi:biotin transporter BioY
MKDSNQLRMIVFASLLAALMAAGACGLPVFAGGVGGLLCRFKV